MIFRVVHGRFKECLSATPILREWKVRHPTDVVQVETSFSELFINNPSVDEVGLWFENGPVIDFDIVEEPGIGIHPIDLYALAAFGDTRLQSRQMNSFVPYQETDTHAVLVGREFAQAHPSALEALKQRFGGVAVVGDRSVGETLKALSCAKAYVGRDEDTSWLAMTTDVPMVMCCGPRPPKSCRPFRWQTPFETLAWKCEWADVCLSRFASTHFGQLLHVYCQKNPLMSCEALVSDQEVVEAVGRILRTT